MDEEPDNTRPEPVEPKPPVIPDDPAEGIPTDIEHRGGPDKAETLDNVIRELRNEREG